MIGPWKAIVASLVAALALIGAVGVAYAEDAPPDQSAYTAWLAADPTRPGEVAAFEAFLAEESVSGVIPTWQLLRTATSWRRCGAPFETPPRRLWPNIVPALRFVRDRVIPVIGPVEAVAVYRNEAMNACARGARASAHRSFTAVDLIPVRRLALADLTAALCPIHAAHGPRARVGLGFYLGRRFHIDANGYRTWGPDHRAASSPCAP